MWGGILATILQFKGVIGNLAVVLMGPYLLWVSYASALTFWIWQHNATPDTTAARKVRGRVTGGVLGPTADVLAAGCFNRRTGAVALLAAPTERQGRLTAELQQCRL